MFVNDAVIVVTVVPVPRDQAKNMLFWIIAAPAAAQAGAVVAGRLCLSRCSICKSPHVTVMNSWFEIPKYRVMAPLTPHQIVGPSAPYLS